MIKQLVLIKPGDVVLDYAFWRPTSQDIIDLNIKCVVRYISFGTSGKRVSLDEIRFLHSNGVAVLIVFEWSATRANLGRPAGLEDGKFSNGMLKILGYPVDSRLACIFAIDTNTVPTNIQAHKDYSLAFDEGLGEYTASGVYGDNDIIAYCIMNNITILNWYAGARAWSDFKPPISGTHVQQLISGSTLNYDNNKVLIPFYAWLPNEEEEMNVAFFEVENLPGQYMWIPGSNPIPFTNPTDRDVLLKGLGVDPADGGKISEEMYNRLFTPVGSFPSKINLTLDLSNETAEGTLS